MPGNPFRPPLRALSLLLVPTAGYGSYAAIVIRAIKVPRRDFHAKGYRALWSIGGWRARVRALKRDTYALYLAARDPRVPIMAKAIAGVVVAYALSPIDLIPDFIPVIGYLDDLVILPLGIYLAIKLIPGPIWAECRRRADVRLAEDLPRSRRAAVVIAAIWLAAAIWVAVLIIK